MQFFLQTTGEWEITSSGTFASDMCDGCEFEFSHRSVTAAIESSHIDSNELPTNRDNDLPTSPAEAPQHLSDERKTRQNSTNGMLANQISVKI